MMLFNLSERKQLTLGGTSGMMFILLPEFRLLIDIPVELPRERPAVI